MPREIALTNVGGPKRFKEILRPKTLGSFRFPRSMGSIEVLAWKWGERRKNVFFELHSWCGS